jgi:hypothetical protein
MISSKTSLLVFLCMSLMIAGCGNKGTNVVLKNTSLRTIFVKGDPTNLLKGSTSNSTSFITPANLEDFSNYSLTGITQFTEREEVIEQQDVGNIESGNEATEEDATKKAGNMIFSFAQNGNDYIYSSPSDNLELAFELTNGKLDLTSLQIKNGGIYNLQGIHYSVKKTGKAFSILAKLDDQDGAGKILLAFSFVKKTEQKEIPKTASTYKYIYGAGVIVPWEQKEILEVDICGAPSVKIENLYRAGINMWTQALANRLKIVTKSLNIYPPFSDLNTHCIYTVNNYLTLPDNRVMNPGTTYTVGDTFQGKLVDSDIMIWVKENEKSGQTLEERSSLQKTIGHEFGHLLGLDHQFSDTLTSIMSYDGIDWVTNYDEDAISQLYPIIK